MTEAALLARTRTDAVVAVQDESRGWVLVKLRTGREETPKQLEARAVVRVQLKRARVGPHASKVDGQ